MPSFCVQSIQSITSFSEFSKIAMNLSLLPLLLRFQWYINTFPDYEFVFLHQPSASVGQIAWLVPTMGPPLFLAVALAIIGANIKFLCTNVHLRARLFLLLPLLEVSRHLKRTSSTIIKYTRIFFAPVTGVPVVVSCVLGIAWHLYLEMRYNGDTNPTDYPPWARKWTYSGFPVYGAKGYFNSTNASLAIGVRRTFGTLHDPQALRFKHQVRRIYKRN